MVFICNSVLSYRQAAPDEMEDGMERPVKPVNTHERPGWIAQFRILADRTFKNLYRNPMLMFAHYTIAVVLACKSILQSSKDHS